MATGVDQIKHPDGRQFIEAEALLARIASQSHIAGGGLWPQLLNTSPRDRQTLAERRYRALIEQIPVVTFLAAVDQEMQELYVSPQIEALLGFTQREWLENPFLWYNQLHPDDRRHWAEQFAQTCATGADFRSDYRLIARDGRVVWVHGECQVIRDDHGRPLFLQGIAYDITESKRAQEIMRRASQELEELVQERTAELSEQVRQRAQLADTLAEEMRRKDQFLAVLAHELRNPLAPILPALDLLRNSAEDQAERDWAIDMIGRQVRQISKLIEDLLDISRISRGKIALNRAIVDLTTLVDRALEVLKPLLEKFRHRVSVHRAGKPVLVNGDPVRLEQVITNLLINAAKFTPPGGEIEVHLRREQSQAILRVRDNGAGIPHDMLEMIFEMFTQVETSLARPVESGLGIGLALVRGLVQLHGGSISAHSQGLGHGSEFTVRLPLASMNAVVAARGGPCDGQPPLAQRNVVVLEDNVDMARALSALLILWGQNVRTFHTGPEAISHIMADPPDLVVMDIGLRGMDGFEVARQVRQLCADRHIFLAALTGYGRTEDRQRAREIGFDAYLTKPVSADVLHQLLRSAENDSAHRSSDFFP